MNSNDSERPFFSIDSGYNQHTEGVTHTGDGGDDFSYSKTKSDIADLFTWYACLQEDVKRKGIDLGRRKALIRF